MTDTAFLEADEQALAQRFIDDGFVTAPADDRAGLDRIQRRAAELAADYLKLPHGNDPYAMLDTIHSRVSVEMISTACGMHVFNGLNAEPWLRPTYFRLARSTIETIVGNELCMQRRINLSIQMPGDDSLAARHPFRRLVGRLAVRGRGVGAAGRRPPHQIDVSAAAIPERRHAGPDGQPAQRRGTVQDHQAARDFIEIPYGHVMLFNQTLMHGNRINEEAGTRWSMNCRFKSIMSPYADKRFGEFFEPILLRPATRVGMQYKLPGGFHG